MSGTIRAPLLVLGAAGVIGAGVVQQAIEAGWPVIAVDRDADGLARLRHRHPDADLDVLQGSLATDSDGVAVVDALRAMGRPLAGVVATIAGGGTRGRLLDRPSATLCHQLDQDLIPHLVAARQLLPLLAQADRGASYILIGGPGGSAPWAGYGHRSVAAAAVHMLASVLHDEARTLGLRLHLLSVDVPVCAEQERIKACPHWPTAPSIGRRALELIDRDESIASQPVVHYDRQATLAATTPAANAGHESVSSYVRHLLARTLRGERTTAMRATQDPDIAPGQESRRYPPAPPAAESKWLTFPLREAPP